MSSGDFIKGIGIGLAAGSVIGMIVAPEKKNAKIASGKVIKTVGSIVESLGKTFG